jgi:hypothetical protein
MKIVCSFIVFLSVACTSSNRDKVEATESKIDSMILLRDMASITKEITVSEFVLALGLCEDGDDWESVLTPIRFVDTESSVNHYMLEGGGGVSFTTRINLEDREMVDAVYSKALLNDTITSFNYSCDGRDYSFKLVDGHYVDSTGSVPTNMDRVSP